MKKKSLATFALLLCVTISALGQNQWDGGSGVATITTNGKVGIGNTTPAAKLDIVSSTGFGSTNTSGLKIANKNGGPAANIVEVTNQMIQVPAQDPVSLFWVRGDGQVGVSNSLRIGATEANGSYSNYKLSVDGDMIAKRCVIQLDNWADYVFNDDYKLLPLTNVADYIRTHKHLPGVPSEAEVKNNGVDIGDMNKVLLKKIEELTLYMIELKKDNDMMRTAMKKNGIE